MWDFCKDLFPDAVYLSIPGHGDLIQQHCPDMMVEIAKIIFSKIDLNNPFQIIGHSMGGYLIPSLIKLGAKPERIGIFHSKIGDDDIEKKEQRQRAIDLVQKNKNLYVRTMITHLFSDASQIKKYQLIESLISDALLISSQTIIACQKAMKERECGLTIIKNFQSPIHYFAGTIDLSVPLNIVLKENVTLGSISTLTTAEDTGHMGQFECPAKVIEWLQTYFCH